jgi:uncharacterized protein (TIGR03083 family)
VLLTPRYGDRPIVSVEPRVAGAHPVLAQRRRLEALLAELSDEEWSHSSRCAEWTVQDVVTHLVSTNQFWAFSIQAGAAGEPTRFLSTFDPVASPAELVDQAQGTRPAETLEQLRATTEALRAVLDGLDDQGWQRLAEAPPGHLPIMLVADHALWDCWVHERDIVLPLGRPAIVEPDEVLTCLRYGAALGRAFGVCAGAVPGGPVALEVADPDAQIVVTLDGEVVHVTDGPVPEGAAEHRGDAVAVLEMLSLRDVGQPVPAVVQTLTAGLATVFDQPTLV